MASLVTMKVASLSIPFPSSRHHNRTHVTPISHSSSEIHQQKDAPFIAQYLISSFGFSKERALKITVHNNLTPIQTPDRPNSVVGFLRDNGLSDIQIKQVISWAPTLLSYSVSKTLQPAANEVIAAGFTRETLVQLIQYNPLALTRKATVSRLQFWRNFVGSEKAFAKIIKSGWVIGMNHDKKIIPGINLLREYGLSDKEIAILVTRSNYFLFQSPDSIKSKLEQVEKLGFARGSKMFLNGLAVFNFMKKDTIDTKIAFFKMTYGWSEEDISLAIRKFPRLLLFSLENIKSTMDFLIKKVGFNPRSIATSPVLIGYSLERRLIPRHYVLTVLKSKGLKSEWNFQTVAIRSEKLFVEKFILPYIKEIPDLGEKYAAALAGEMHV